MFRVNIKSFIGFSLFISLMCSNSYANSFYIGADIGPEMVNFDKKLTIVDNATKNTDYYKEDNLSGRGFNGDVFAGYSYHYNRFYLGGELNASLSTLKYKGFYIDNTQNQISEGDFTLDKSYGISILPGYQLTNNALVYGRLGYARGNFKYSEYKDNVNGVTERSWLNGYRYGAGIATSLTDQLGLRLEYNHLSYQRFTNNNFPGFPGKVRTISLKPEIDSFELGLVYRFS